MLVLSRKLHEKIFLLLEDGRRVEILVVDIDRGKIRLGFNAPRGINIFREELLSRDSSDPAANPPPETTT
jgi:carbon storage regulator